MSGAYPSRVERTTPGERPGPWREVRRVAETGSTNADLLAAAAAGEPAGLVLVADRQTAGRGRLDRHWDSPPGSGLTFSVLLRPPVPVGALGWLPLLTGLAVADGVAEATAVDARLKWPNDVLVGDRKLAGVLAEVSPGPASSVAAVIVGVGVNVELEPEQLPVPQATALSLEGASTIDRAVVLDAILVELDARVRSWLDANGDAEACGLRAAYTVRCATIGRRVRVEMSQADAVEGEAVGVDEAGHLRVADPGTGGLRVIAAGDVVHLR